MTSRGSRPDICVLGPISLFADGRAVSVGGPLARRLLGTATSRHISAEMAREWT